MTQTPLDLAVDDRPRFFNIFASAELFVLLRAEAFGDQIEPEVFETDEGRFVLVFDHEDRLGQFVGGPAPYAAMTGRNLASMLAGQSISVALNPDVAPSSQLLPADAIDWLHGTLQNDAQEIGARPEEVLPPQAPEALVTSLDAKLAAATGLARSAYLVAANYAQGRKGHILAFIDALPGAEAALTQAVSEALTFADIDAASLDVAFFDASDPMAARLAKVGFRFDLPIPEATLSVKAPGSDPNAPPKLR